jgi:NADH:ubiquinone oxidoreductase subunit D
MTPRFATVRALIQTAAEADHPIQARHVLVLLDELERMEARLVPLESFVHDVKEAFANPVFVEGHSCRPQTVLARLYRANRRLLEAV